MKLKSVALFAALATSAFAQLINISTGQDTSPANGIDDKWTVGISPLSGGVAYVVVSDGFPVPSPWLDYSPANGSSKWISPTDLTAGGTGDTSPVDLFTYSYTFFVGPDFVASDLTFRLSTDNLFASASLNGTPLLGISSSGFTSFSPFYNFNSGFVAGLNTLKIEVENLNDGAPNNTFNPTGLRLEGSVLLTNTAVPEPSTYGMIGVAALGLVVYLKRRRSKA